MDKRRTAKGETLSRAMRWDGLIPAYAGIDRNDNRWIGSES